MFIKGSDYVPHFLKKQPYSYFSSMGIRGWGEVI